MLHRLIARFAFAAAAALAATSVSASENRLWAEGNDYVQLEHTEFVNQHPVVFSSEQLVALLSRFYKREGNKEAVPYFTQDEINRIAPDLARQFAKAKPGDDIDFGTSFRPGNFALMPRTLNAGRLFVSDGRLNLLVGMCAAQQDVGYQQAFGKYRDLDHGSRARPADKLGCELLAGSDVERADNRPDWLRLNIEAALATKTVPVYANESRTLTFGTSAAQGAATPAPAPTAPAAAPAVAAPAAAAPAAAAPALAAKPAQPQAPANDAEERLILLKRLHEKGLITDAEYEQKRSAVLQGL